MFQQDNDCYTKCVIGMSLGLKKLSEKTKNKTVEKVYYIFSYSN